MDAGAERNWLQGARGLGIGEVGRWGSGIHTRKSLGGSSRRYDKNAQIE